MSKCVCFVCKICTVLFKSIGPMDPEKENTYQEGLLVADWAHLKTA